MNPLRFDQIKKATDDYNKSHVTDLDLAGLGDIFAMLQECVAELEQRFKPTPARTSGPRPVILDGQGKPVLPPPIVQQFEGERRNQYALDRHVALMTLDPDQWRVFSLRWGLTPPPGGWGNHEAILNVMHAVRVNVKSIPYLDKHMSAVYLTSKGIKLPPGVAIVNGTLTGVEYPD